MLGRKRRSKGSRVCDPRPIQPSIFSRVLFGGLPLLTAAGPLVTVYRGLSAIRLVCAFLVVYAVVFLLGRSPWRRADVWLLATTVAFVCAGVLGLRNIGLGADNPYSEFLSIVLGLFTALAGRSWQRRAPLLYLSLCRGWVVSAILVCLVAAWEVTSGQHLSNHLVSAGSQPSAAFGNPNSLAIFVVMGNVWAMPVRRAGGTWWRTASGCLLLMTLPLLIVTGARLATVMWVILLVWSVWNTTRRSISPLAGVGAAIIPSAIGIGVLAAEPRVLSYFVEVSTRGSSGNVRADLTSQGLHFALHQRGLPSGPGSFEALMRENYSAIASTGGVVNAHNVWVEILVQYGALSLVIILGWMIACAFPRAGVVHEMRPAVVTLLVLGIVDSSLLDDAQMWLFVLAMAMASRLEIRSAATSALDREAVAP